MPGPAAVYRSHVVAYGILPPAKVTFAPALLSEPVISAEPPIKPPTCRYLWLHPRGES